MTTAAPENTQHFADLLQDPARYFTDPWKVIDEAGLTEDQKRSILECWAVDELRLEVATEENMAGGEDNRFDQVKAVLRQLD